MTVPRLSLVSCLFDLKYTILEHMKQSHPIEKITPDITEQIIEEEVKVSYWTGFGAAIAVCSLIVAGIIYYDRTTTPRPSPTAHLSAETIPAAIELPATPPARIKKITLDELRATQGSGELTLVMYTDLECNYCKRFHDAVQAIQPDYVGKLRIAYKHAPLATNDKSVTEAVAAECAGQQGKFFEYIDKIFAATPGNNQLESGTLFKTAAELQLDLDAFNACIDEPAEIIATITADATEARATGAAGAPYAILVNKSGKIIHRFEGAIGKKRLRAELNKHIKPSAVTS
jgi:protein-disulfide isomerase